MFCPWIWPWKHGRAEGKQWGNLWDVTQIRNFMELSTQVPFSWQNQLWSRCCTTPVCVEYIITSLSFSKCLQEWNVPSLWNETATDNHSSPHQRENLSAFAWHKDTTEACPGCVGNQAEAVKPQDEVPHVPAEGPWSESRLQVQEEQSCSAQRTGIRRKRRFRSWLLPFCSEAPCCGAHCSREHFSEKELASQMQTIRVFWGF